MPDLINKLSSYAALVGVVGAIGGGFYAWGEFNTRLSAIENKDFVVNETVDLSTVNKEIKDLNEKLNINVQELTSIQNGNFIELLDMQAADHKEAVDLIRSVEAALEALKGDVAINGAAIEINELKAANDNPLLN